MAWAVAVSARAVMSWLLSSDNCCSLTRRPRGGDEIVIGAKFLDRVIRPDGFLLQLLHALLSPAAGHPRRLILCIELIGEIGVGHATRNLCRHGRIGPGEAYAEDIAAVEPLDLDIALQVLQGKAARAILADDHLGRHENRDQHARGRFRHLQRVGGRIHEFRILREVELVDNGQAHLIGDQDFDLAQDPRFIFDGALEGGALIEDFAAVLVDQDIGGRGIFRWRYQEIERAQRQHDEQRSRRRRATAGV